MNNGKQNKGRRAWSCTEYLKSTQVIQMREKLVICCFCMSCVLGVTVGNLVVVMVGGCIDLIKGRLIK